MILKLYQRVSLREDIPDADLRAGDVATLIEFVPHPAGGPPGTVLEIFNAIGGSVAVVTVPVTQIEPLRADELLSVRTLAKAS